MDGTGFLFSDRLNYGWWWLVWFSWSSCCFVLLGWHQRWGSDGQLAVSILKWIQYDIMEYECWCNMNGIWTGYEHIRSLNFADFFFKVNLKWPQRITWSPCPGWPGASRESGKRLWKMQREVAVYLGSQWARPQGEPEIQRWFFLCGCDWLPLIHILLEGLEGHLTSMFLFLKCFSSLYENWYMNTVVTVSTYQISTQCCLNLLLCARSSFLQVLEPFRAKCGWHWLENCYSRGKDWWKSDEVVPLQGGVAFGKQPDSWCSQYKWQICMHW